MKRTDSESVGDVLRALIQEANFRNQLEESRAVELFFRIIGEGLAAKMGHPKVRNGLMMVAVTSAPLRHEMMMSRSTIVKLINDKIGREVIKDIKFI